MSPTSNEMLARVLRHVPQAASVVLVIAIAHQAAGLTWQVFAPAPTGGTATTTAGGDSARTVDPESIVSRHLFGRGDAPASVADIQAPDTNLNLTLKGIAAAEERSRSRALIAGPDGKDKNYATGADLPGGATVHEILPDRVILNRRGTLETLRLPKHAAPAGATRTAAASRPSADLRQQANEERLAEFVRPQAVMVDGQLRGFRVYPGRNRRAFAESGLRAGDLVTAINGMPLDDPERGVETLRELLGMQDAVLTVERGGQVESVTVRLPQ